MYYKQLPCIYHPDLNITNFCQDQDCLMPLCPSCIRQHTEYHEQIKTKPSYFNIYEALAQTDTLISSYICNLQKDKKRNSELIFKVNRLPAIVHEKIQQAKSMAMKIVEQSFSQLQKSTLDTISRINQELSMHSLRKSQSLEESMVSNLQDLYDLAGGLKTESCLSDMIFFLKEKRFQVEDLHSQMSRYLYSNQNYEPYIQINKEAQHSLAIVIQRMFKVDPKQKSQATRNIDRAQNKNMYDNSYHISLTPSKVKMSLYSLEKQKTINPSFKFAQNYNNLPMSSRQKNTSYQNFNQYQQHMQRTRQNSREKNLRSEDGSFRQINIKVGEKKVLYPQLDNDASLGQKGGETMTKKVPGVRYGGGKF